MSASEPIPELPDSLKLQCKHLRLKLQIYMCQYFSQLYGWALHFSKQSEKITLQDVAMKGLRVKRGGEVCRSKMMGLSALPFHLSISNEMDFEVLWYSNVFTSKHVFFSDNLHPILHGMV